MIFSPEEIQTKIKELKGWSYENNSIQKEFELKDFSSVLAFTVRVGVESEKADHHPDIFIHSWNKCKISIATHSEGGVTQKDFDLASSIENL